MADTSPLTVLIADDEPLARMRMQALLEACPEPECRVAGEAADGMEAMAWLEAPDHACDVVMLDISMPGMDGLQVAERIAALAAPPAIVFVTAHGEHALKAFDLAATDYLTKPVRRERLQAALQRVAQRRAAAAPAAGASPGAADGVLTVNDRGRTLRLPFAEIVYLKAELKYVTLHAAQRQWVLDESLAELEQRLGPRFLRIHRNALVSLDAVRALERRPSEDEDGAEGWAVQLSTGDWLAVSRRQVAAVRDALAGPGEPGGPGGPGGA